MLHHNHNPVYFTLIPSHDCEVIKLQNILLIFLFLGILQKVLVPSFVSNPNLEYIFCQHNVYRLRPYSISSSTYPNVCCCILHTNSKICCYVSTLLFYSEGQFIANAPTGRLKPIWLFPCWFFATINSYIPQLLKFHRYFTVEGALVARRWPSMHISAKEEISWLLCCGRKMSVNG